MVIDTSALIAILQREPERAASLSVIERAATRVVSTASAVETSIVVLSRNGEDGVQIMQALTRDLHIKQVAFTADHVDIAIDAFKRFGKGRHPGGTQLRRLFFLCPIQGDERASFIQGRGFF